MSPTVLTAEFQHETNTFSRRPADLAAFRDRFCLLDAADAITARGDANTELAGFLDVARAQGWDVVHALSAAAQPSGRVTREAFEALGGAIVQAAERHLAELDGILLGLHGAMVTEDCEDGEGELLRRLRQVVGPELPIAVTLDLHANATVQMCALADIVVSYKTYPHVDMRLAGRQAAEILGRAMAGEIRPKTLRVHLPMLDEANGGRTDRGPMIGWLARARDHEGRPDVYAVSINSGFGNADIAEVGPTVLVTAEGDPEAHRAFAEGLAGDIWAARFEVFNSYLTVEEAAAQAASWSGKAGPLVVADYADNPGGGGYGDSTALMAALLAAGVEDACYGPLVDREAAAELHRHSIGDKVTLALGGKTDPRFGGGPLSLTGEILHLSDGVFTGDGPMAGGLTLSFGPSAVLRVDGIEILVVSVPAQMLDLQQFRAFGIDPAARRVVALKSMQHFRAAFEPIAGDVILCDSGALCTLDLSKLPYERVPRPIYPLDPDMVRPAGAR